MNDKQTLTEIINKLSQVFFEIPFNRMLDLRLGEIKDDYITLHFNMKNELIGNYVYGILHGGVTSSVLDMAGGVAVMVAAIKKRKNTNMDELSEILSKASTINLHINYIRPGKGEHFIAKAFVVHSGNKISFTRMELFNQDSVLIATGTGNYLIG